MRKQAPRSCSLPDQQPLPVWFPQGDKRFCIPRYAMFYRRVGQRWSAVFWKSANRFLSFATMIESFVLPNGIGLGCSIATKICRPMTFGHQVYCCLIATRCFVRALSLWSCCSFSALRLLAELLLLLLCLTAQQMWAVRLKRLFLRWKPNQM